MNALGGVEQHGAQPERLPEREPAFGEPAREGAAGEVLDDEQWRLVPRFEPVDRGEVGMRDRRHGARFAAQPPREQRAPRLQGLDRDRSLEAQVAGAVHDAHAARADALLHHELAGEQPRHRSRVDRAAAPGAPGLVGAADQPAVPAFARGLHGGALARVLGREQPPLERHCGCRPDGCEERAILRGERQLAPLGAEGEEADERTGAVQQRYEQVEPAVGEPGAVVPG